VLSVTRYRVYSADYECKIIPPKGWTTDKEEMDYDYFLGDNVMVRDYGLKSPQPIMRNTLESGDCLHLFQPDSKYYIWNPIEGGIWEIMTSMDLMDIVTEIAKPRMGSLKMEELH
jgi:hypothetical protein